MLPETTKPPRRAAERARGRPRALLNDDDGGQAGAGAGEGEHGGRSHRAPFNRFARLASTQRCEWGSDARASAVNIPVNEHAGAGDDRRNPGGNQKVLGTTLGIRKYLLTWGFAWSKLRLVPDSACQPELNTGPAGTTARLIRMGHGLQFRRVGAGLVGTRSQGRVGPGSRETGCNDDNAGIETTDVTQLADGESIPRRRTEGTGQPGSSQRRRLRQRAGQPETEPKSGIARRAFGHDGRCEQFERKANASRSICGGSSHLRAAPGGRAGFGRACLPGALTVFRTGAAPPCGRRNVKCSNPRTRTAGTHLGRAIR
jgi:hypothetical protein